MGNAYKAMDRVSLAISTMLIYHVGREPGHLSPSSVCASHYSFIKHSGCPLPDPSPVAGDCLGDRRSPKRLVPCNAPGREESCSISTGRESRKALSCLFPASHPATIAGCLQVQREQFAFIACPVCVCVYAYNRTDVQSAVLIEQDSPPPHPRESHQTIS